MNDRYHCLDTDNKLIWNFRDIGHIVRHISEGKGSQKRILIILNETGVVTQSELTQRLGIQPGSASEVFGKLENAGLIVRTPNEADRRTTDIHLTEEGKAQAEIAAQQRVQRHNAMLACLSQEEKETLLSLLEKIEAYWKSQPHERDGKHEHHEHRKGHGRRDEFHQG